MFSTKHAQALFRVASPQTIRNWANEFQNYLSPSAKPGSGNARRFSEEDMRVLALIAEISSQGRPFEVVHAALASGQRGELPNLTPEEIDVLVAGEVERHLSLQLHEARDIAQRLQDELDALKVVVQPLHDETVRLKAQLEEAHKQVEDYRQQVRESQETLRRVEREAGEAYYRGRLDEARNQFNPATQSDGE